MARTNYAYCFGDSQIGQNNMVLDVDVTRGAFQRGMYFGLNAITDGAANTIMFGEIATVETRSLNRNSKPRYYREGCKIQGRAIYTLGSSS